MRQATNSCNLGLSGFDESFAVDLTWVQYTSIKTIVQHLFSCFNVTGIICFFFCYNKVNAKHEEKHGCWTAVALRWLRLWNDFRDLVVLVDYVVQLLLFLEWPQLHEQQVIANSLKLSIVITYHYITLFFSALCRLCQSLYVLPPGTRFDYSNKI